jgi:hypothetical protein
MVRLSADQGNPDGQGPPQLSREEWERKYALPTAQ